MKIVDVKQNSLEWLMARSGIPTASEWDALISPTWKIRDGKMVSTYVAQKVAEAWTNSPIANFMNIDMEYGRVLEDEAVPWLWDYLGAPIERPGFILSDDGHIGCSPDGTVGEIGVEIKCPAPLNHVKYLMTDGLLEEEYGHQAHGSMLVTGFSEWKLVSYHRSFPKLVLTIKRDEKKIAVLREALTAFLERFDAAMKRLEELNGGPMRRTTKPDYQPPQPKTEEPEYNT